MSTKTRLMDNSATTVPRTPDMIHLLTRANHQPALPSSFRQEEPNDPDHASMTRRRSVIGHYRPHFKKFCARGNGGDYLDDTASSPE